MAKIEVKYNLHNPVLKVFIQNDNKKKREIMPTGGIEPGFKQLFLYMR